MPVPNSILTLVLSLGFIAPGRIKPRPAQLCSADFQSAVSQVSNLRTSEKASGMGMLPDGRLEVGDTAGWKPALRGVESSELDAALFIAPVGAQTSPREITLNLRTRHPQTGQPVITPLKIDPRQVGIVIVDAWNYHWCMTWTEQAGGMTPRMNRALEGGRTLGMTVLWGPTDTASRFSS